MPLDRHLFDYAVLQAVDKHGGPHVQVVRLPTYPNEEGHIVSDYGRLNELLTGEYDAAVVEDTVDRLVDQGLIDRQRDPCVYGEDSVIPERYAANLRITEEGYDTLDRAWSKYD